MPGQLARRQERPRSRGWRASTCWARCAGQWRGGAVRELVPIFPLWKLLLRRDSSPRRTADIFRERRGAGESSQPLTSPPHTASGAGLGGLGVGRVCPTSTGHPFPAPCGHQEQAERRSTILGLGVSGRDVPSPAWRRLGWEEEASLDSRWDLPGESGGPSPPRGRGLVTASEL